MKDIVRIIFLVLFVLCPEQSRAETLLSFLSYAHQNNSKLNAERASVRAANEGIEEARGEFKPSITISGYFSEQDNKKGTESNLNPSEQSLLIEQKIFQGYSGVANLKKEEYKYELAKFDFQKIEQEVLLSAIKSYTDYLLNIKKVRINKINIDLLERQVETDRARLERGEINLTDLSQSESSLSGGKAKLIAAENDFITSKANFEKNIGKNPSKNMKDFKKDIFKLPKSLAEAHELAQKENPDLKIAYLELKKAEQDIIISRSEISPSATLSYKIAEQGDISTSIKDRRQQTLKATATWPIYSGGTNLASIRKSEEIRNQKELLLEDTKKIVITDVTNAWSKFQSSKGVLKSIISQVKAAEIANEGISLEYESGGNRTTLEVIQSRSILLDARINLAVSERDLFVSKFNLLSALGRLTAENLGIDK